jgi:hypothetical protein
VWDVQEATERKERLERKREQHEREELDLCRQFTDPSMGGASFNRTAAVDLTARDETGRMTPNTMKGARLYEIGLQSRAAFEAKMAHLKEELSRLEPWVCSLCAATNPGNVDVCQNVVKSGKEVRGRDCLPRLHRLHVWPPCAAVWQSEVTGIHSEAGR